MNFLFQRFRRRTERKVCFLTSLCRSRVFYFIADRTFLIVNGRLIPEKSSGNYFSPYVINWTVVRGGRGSESRLFFRRYIFLFLRLAVTNWCRFKGDYTEVWNGLTVGRQSIVFRSPGSDQFIVLW